MSYSINHFQPRSVYSKRFNLPGGGFVVEHQGTIKGFRTFPQALKFARAIPRATPSFYSDDFYLDELDISSILKKSFAIT